MDRGQYGRDVVLYTIFGVACIPFVGFMPLIIIYAALLIEGYLFGRL